LKLANSRPTLGPWRPMSIARALQ